MKKILFLLLFLGVEYIQAQDSIDPCNIYDVVVVLDQSASVSSNFQIACIQVGNFFQTLNIGTHAVHAGFVTFSDLSIEVHPLSSFKESLVEAALTMSADTAMGSTNLYDGLTTAYRMLRYSERWHDVTIPKVCIVISDGYPTPPADQERSIIEGPYLEYPSHRLAWIMKDNGITIYTIGMDMYRQIFLELLASSPDHFEPSNYHNLAHTLSEINLCK